jgi:hypothetical protein
VTGLRVPRLAALIAIAVLVGAASAASFAESYRAGGMNDYCEDCGIRLDRHGEECGFEIDDDRAPWADRPAGWLNVGTGEFTPIDEEDDR